MYIYMPALMSLQDYRLLCSPAIIYTSPLWSLAETFFISPSSLDVLNSYSMTMKRFRMMIVYEVGITEAYRTNCSQCT